MSPDRPVESLKQEIESLRRTMLDAQVSDAVRTACAAEIDKLEATIREKQRLMAIFH
jgi:hypothetical protein